MKKQDKMISILKGSRVGKKDHKAWEWMTYKPKMEAY